MSTHPFLQLLIETIDTQAPIPRDSRGVAAVSGGADSVGLLLGLGALAQERGWTLVVAHMEHGIRGAESTNDADFVKELAGKLGMKCVVRSVDAPGRAEETGESLEAVARRMRYDFLEECARLERCAWVATGHTAQDNAETVMMNLMRGSGPTGIAGIPIERAIRKGSDIRLVRPLLRHRRAMIEEFLRERGQDWRTDQSNFDRSYTRNQVRHDLLPMMQTQAGGEDIVERLNILAQMSGKLSGMLKEESAGLRQELRADEGGRVGLRCAGLCELPGLLAGEVVREALEEVTGSLRGFERRHIEDVLRLAREGSPGTEIALVREVHVYRDYERVLLGRGPVGMKTFEAVEMTVPGTAQLTKPEAEFTAEVQPRGGRTVAELLAGKDRWSEWLDAERVGPTVEIRPRRPGDRFRPMGPGGERKLQDYMTDRRLSRYLREGWPIVSAGGRIAWVVGLGAGEDFKVGAETRNVVRLTVRSRFFEDGKWEERS